MSSLAKANQLVTAVERHRGLPIVPLGPDNQIAFGTLMFRFLPDQQQLIGAILVSDDPTWNKYDADFTTAYRRSRAALSDDRIGGLFDTGGGAWMFDEASGRTYLYKIFPLDASPEAVDRGIEEMARLVPAWGSRWIGIVADISQGRRPPPSRPVTLEDDPYKDEL